MRKSQMEMVREFHEAFGRPIAPHPIPPTPQTYGRGLALLLEKVADIQTAIMAGDSAALLEAATKTDYVLDGLYLAFGLHDLKDDAFTILHNGNMSKLTKYGQPQFDERGKVIKGPNYCAPDFAALVNSRRPAATILPHQGQLDMRQKEGE